jgi:hypothetical protein
MAVGTVYEPGVGSRTMSPSLQSKGTPDKPRVPTISPRLLSAVPSSSGMNLGVYSGAACTLAGSASAVATTAVQTSVGTCLLTLGEHRTECS